MKKIIYAISLLCFTIVNADDEFLGINRGYTYNYLSSSNNGNNISLADREAVSTFKFGYLNDIDRKYVSYAKTYNGNASGDKIKHTSLDLNLDKFLTNIDDMTPFYGFHLGAGFLTIGDDDSVDLEYGMQTGLLMPLDDTSTLEGGLRYTIGTSNDEYTALALYIGYNTTF